MVYPTEAEIIKSIEMLFLLLPVKATMSWGFARANKERRAIIRRHVTQKHDELLANCMQGDCVTLPASQVQSGSMLLAADFEYSFVD